MVAFKNEPIRKRKKNLWSKGVGREEVNRTKSHPMWSSLRLCLCRVLTGEGNPISVRQSCRVLSVSPHGCFRIPCVLRHCPSISSAALCEENTRCCMWSLTLATRCHGNTNQTAACTSGAGMKWESRVGKNGWGQHKQAVNLGRWLNSSILLEMCERALKLLQGERAMDATECNLCKQRWKEKTPPPEEVTEKKEQPATSNLLHDMSRKRGH